MDVTDRLNSSWLSATMVIFNARPPVEHSQMHQTGFHRAPLGMRNVLAFSGSVSQ
jgi:hypothetical protein